MTEIIVDMTGNIAKKLQDSLAQNHGPVGWTFVKLEAENAYYLSDQGGMQRWRIEDENAPEEMAGKRVEPVFGSQTSMRYGGQITVEDRKVLS